MRWDCMSKALLFLQITAKHQDFPLFTVFVTIKTSSQNISITLLHITWTILKEQLPVRNIAASIMGNGVISFLWQLRSHCNPDHDKFSSLSNTTVVALFPNVCLWRRSLCSTWQVLTLKNCIELLSYASTAYVVASNAPRFFSTVF